MVKKNLGLAISFGLTMAISVYLLYLGGKWLDERLGTYPLFMFIGVVLAIASVFKRLYTDLCADEKRKSRHELELGSNREPDHGEEQNERRKSKISRR